MLRKIIVASALTAAATATSLGVIGCGGQHGTIELDIVESPNDDPFGNGQTALFTVGTETQTVSLMQPGGHYSLSLSEKPPKTAYNLSVQVLDANAHIVGYGQTPLITLNPVDQGPFGMWVGTPGTINPSSAKLPSARTDLAGCGSTGLGGLFAGGHGVDDTGVPVTLGDTGVYDVYTSAMVTSASLTTARAGAVAFPSGPDGVVFGGAVEPAFQQAGDPLATGELFNPTGGVGTFTNVAVSTGTLTPAAYSTATLLGVGSGLVSGGIGADGNPTNATTIVTMGSDFSLAPGPTMTAARVHHAVAPTTFTNGGPGALVIGGLTNTGDAVAEKLLGSTSVSLAGDPTVAGVPNLWYATATQVNNGVLLIGGTVGNTRVATNTLLLITTQSGNPEAPTDFSALKLPPRAGHTATMVGNDILLCGGWNATGTLYTSCDLVGTSPTITYLGSVNGLTARQHHVAVALETGPVLLAGGDDGTSALDSIDIYTPTMAEEAVINVTNGAVLGGASSTDGGSN